MRQLHPLAEVQPAVYKCRQQPVLGSWAGKTDTADQYDGSKVPIVSVPSPVEL